MHTDDEDLFIIGPVEYADTPPFGHLFHRPPEIIMGEFLRRRGLEAYNLAPLRVHAGHDVLDDPVLPRRVHRLEYQEQGVGVLRVEDVLQRGKFDDVGLEFPRGVFLR